MARNYVAICELSSHCDGPRAAVPLSMVTGDMTFREPRIPDEGVAALDYRGHRLTLLPRSSRAWMVVERRRCVGILELTHPHIGDDGPRYATKRVGEEHAVVEGWTDDWRLAVEWLVDQEFSPQSPPPPVARSRARRGTSPS